MDPTLRPCGLLPETALDEMVEDTGFLKLLDPKRKLNFFYNTYSGESTWKVRESPWECGGRGISVLV